MARILFGHSYFLRFDPKLWQAMQPYPPLGTLYAAAYLREKGYEVALFDAVLAESEMEWQAKLVRHQPRFAVLFEDNFNYLSKMCLLRMRQAAFTMIRMAAEQSCTVIVCGADATDHAKDYLSAGADYVLIGEGEVTLGELLDSLSGQVDTPLYEIQGLAFSPAALVNKGYYSPTQFPNTLLDGDTFFTPRRPDIRDLDRLPFPAWDLADISLYRKIWLDRHGYFSLNMVTTRGCPFHCNWCAKPIWGQRYNVRSPKNVVKEIDQLQQAFSPDHIWFMDDIIGLKPGWLSEFADLMALRGLKIPFKCLSRADLLLRPGEIDALQRSGAQIVWIGAESGSQKVLDAMEKGIQVKQIDQVTEKLRAAGIQVAFFLQFGYPGETWTDIQDTIRMVRRCLPDDIGISVSYPLPGTPFFERVRHELGDKQNWETSDDLAMLYHGPYSTAFYRQLHTVVHYDYRVRKTWRQFVNKVRRSPSRGSVSLRKLAAMVYYAFRLPLDRKRLERLAAQPHKGIRPLTPLLTPEQAAAPSLQSDE